MYTSVAGKQNVWILQKMGTEKVAESVVLLGHDENGAIWGTYMEL